MIKSRTQYSIVNALTGAIAQVFIVLLGFISRTAFIHFLPLEYLGIQGLFTNVLTVLSFAELGIGEAMVYALYQPVKENDRVKTCQLMQLYKKAYRFVAAIVFSLGLILSFFIDFFVNQKPNIPENFQLIFMLFVFNSASSYLFSYKKSILLVDQKRYIVTGCHQLFLLIQTILQIGFLYFTQNYLIFLIIQVLCTIADNVGISLYVTKEYPYLNTTSDKKLDKEEESVLFSNVKALAISKISGVVSNSCTNIIISKISGLSLVGIVSNYILIINAVNGVIWAGLTGISGSLGNLNVDAGPKKKQQIFNQLFIFSFWIYTCACVCLLNLLNPFIEIWLGRQFLIPETVIFVMVWSIYISGVNYPVYSFRTTLGYFVQVQYVFFLGGILNIIFSTVGGLYFGLLGIVLGTPISRLLTSEIADGYYVYKLGFHTNPINYFKKYILYFLLYLLCCKVSSFAVNLISVHGISGFLIKLMVTLVIVNLILILVFARNRNFLDLAHRLPGIKNFF
ncbi:lipopolysaccharide biosynthesis protein [Acidaminococcus massiliensis]|uniref:lipopolysaccharide biosynthesis protein n=1 Tax=Acidaminococcus massiliensis TaxID=1852375 RepID=UPI00266DACAD|nr:hypothetical protein [Acidaminococcus massiliensis]